MKGYLLEFLIPTYKRFDGAIKAARSIASQIRDHSFEESVTIRIVDDGSPDFSCDYMTDALAEWQNCILIEANHSNKGMSLNIYDMVASSTSEFCSILTDDDWLSPGALPEIIACLDRAAYITGIGGIFTPRYSYLEDGSLHCVVCQPFRSDNLLTPGPVNSLRYCHNGFILTGFIFRPSLMAKAEWQENIDNSFFPVINFWAILSANSILFVNRNWFHHTVVNFCHWEAWGDGPKAQRRRLYTDYMEVIAFIAQRSCCKAGSVSKRLAAFFFEVTNYVRQIVSYLQTSASEIFCISPLVANRNAFRVALFLTPFLVLYLRLRRALGRPVKAILKDAGFWLN